MCLPSLLTVICYVCSSYNIYTDPNVAEVVKTFPVLSTLIQSTDSLLDQWPEHPVLNQVREMLTCSAVFLVSTTTVYCNGHFF